MSSSSTTDESNSNSNSDKKDTIPSSAASTSSAGTYMHDTENTNGWGSWKILNDVEQRIGSIASNVQRSVSSSLSPTNQGQGQGQDHVEEEKKSHSEIMYAAGHDNKENMTSSRSSSSTASSLSSSAGDALEKKSTTGTGTGTGTTSDGTVNDSIENDLNELVDNIGSAFASGASALTSLWSKSITSIQQSKPHLQEKLQSAQIGEKANNLKSLAKSSLTSISHTVQQAAINANQKLHHLASSLEAGSQHTSSLQNANSFMTMNKSDHSDAFTDAFNACGGNETVQALQFVSQSCLFTVKRSSSKLSADVLQSIELIFKELAVLLSTKQTSTDMQNTGTVDESNFGVFVRIHSSVVERIDGNNKRIADTYNLFSSSLKDKLPNSTAYEQHDTVAAAIIDLYTYFIETSAQTVADILTQSNSTLNELIEPNNVDVPKQQQARILFATDLAKSARLFLDDISARLNEFSKTTHKHVQLMLSITPSSESQSFQQLMNITEQLTTDLYECKLVIDTKLECMSATLLPVLQLIILEAPAQNQNQTIAPSSAASKSSNPAITISIPTATTVGSASSDDAAVSGDVSNVTSSSSTPLASLPNTNDVLKNLNSIMSPLESSDLYQQLNSPNKKVTE
jgi:hypothetical protein